MKYLQFIEDICVAGSDEPRNGFISNPKNIPMEVARLEDDIIIDASTRTTFYVDEKGLRHLKHRKGRQELHCHVLEPLIIEDKLFMKETL